MKAKVHTQIKIKLLTESKILDRLLSSIDETSRGDSIRIAMFEFKQPVLMKKLVEASNRGVSVNMILDPNMEVFGFPSLGFPSRLSA